MQVSYMRLGENKGAKRLWVQGRRLSTSGFNPGVSYAVSYEDNGALTIRISEDGTHKVCSKKQGENIVPVIDINNRALEKIFGKDVTRVRAIIREGEIEVTIHPDEAARKERLERVETALRAGKPLKVGSVAHGGGVLDHALHEGLKIGAIPTELAFAIEIEHEYLETSLANNPVWTKNSISIEAPMQDVETSLLGKVEIMAGGLPCQGASVAGKAKNGNKTAEEHETAGALFVAFLQIIKAVNPAVIVLEQVVPYQKTVSMSVIRNVLSQMGYSVHETVLDETMGALEARKRLCVVATTEGLSFDWSELVPVRNKEQTIGEVLEQISDDDERWKPYSYLADKEVRDIAAGKGFRTQLLGPDATSCGTIGKGYMKCRSTEPRIRHPHNSGLSRLLTPREHARVKTIPEALVEGISDTRAHEILGQSVVHAAFVAVGNLIATSINRYLAALTMTPDMVALPEPTLTAGEHAAATSVNGNVAATNQLCFTL